MLKNIRRLLIIFAIALLAGGVGYKLGTSEVKVGWANFKPSVEVVNKLPPQSKAADFSLFWRVWDEVMAKYVDRSKLDSQKMVYGAISGMVSALGDPYTVFLPPQQNQEVKEELNGSFEGIGAQLGVKDKKIVVVAPLIGQPADKSGLLAADWIVKVDGAETTNWTLPQAVTQIRGPRGTKVTLTVFHPKADKPVDITIVRETIVLKSVDWKLMDRIAYVQLVRFGDETNSQWDKTVLEINKSASVSAMILDLRNNPGGFLSGAVYVASEFLESGVVVKQESRLVGPQTYSVSRVGKLLKIPTVVLVNQGTASASEILAGALQAVGRAKLIGSQTFGKGSVQEAEDLPNGSGLHVTTAKWLLSNDVWVNGTGLTPDVKIENDQNDPSRDLQLARAIELLTTTSQ